MTVAPFTCLRFRILSSAGSRRLASGLKDCCSVTCSASTSIFQFNNGEGCKNKQTTKFLAGRWRGVWLGMAEFFREVAGRQTGVHNLTYRYLYSAPYPEVRVLCELVPVVYSYGVLRVLRSIRLGTVYSEYRSTPVRVIKKSESKQYTYTVRRVGPLIRSSPYSGLFGAVTHSNSALANLL
jgi:hypothetical protein